MGMISERRSLNGVCRLMAKFTCVGHTACRELIDGSDSTSDLVHFTALQSDDRSDLPFLLIETGI
jgi:hypothetical protein